MCKRKAYKNFNCRRPSPQGRYGQSDVAIDISKQAPRKVTGKGRRAPTKEELNVDAIDFSKKVLYLAWHPTQPTIAVAGLNNLYIYSQH